MKIIRKVVMPKVTCRVCRTIFIPGKKDLTDTIDYRRFDHARCPVCRTSNRVFDRPEIE